MRLLIVDGSNVVMRCALGGDIGPEQAVATATRMIERAAADRGLTHLVVTLDCPGVESWRSKIYPPYKANRDRDTAPWLYAAAAAWLKRQWWVEAVAGYEADDIIATLSLRVHASGRPVMILSGDSDVLPLTQHEGITVLKPLNGGVFSLVSAQQVCAKYGIARPEQLVDFKAMTGESGDNVPGVDGIGPVRARQLLASYTTLEGVIAAGQRAACKHSKIVAEAAAIAWRARQLVTLSTDAPVVPIQPKACELSIPYTPHHQPGDRRELPAPKLLRESGGEPAAGTPDLFGRALGYP